MSQSFVIVMINWQQKASCCLIWSVITLVMGLCLCSRPLILLIDHSYNYRLSWTPLSPITIIYRNVRFKLTTEINGPK